MSIVPLVFRDWWDDFDRPVSRLIDQHFGSGLNRDDLISNFNNFSFNRPSLRPMFGNTYYRPWRNVARQNSGSSTIQLENDNFQVILDVQQFSPEEITVKTIDNQVSVEAKHEERQDEHGYVSRHFVRRYVLPPSHDLVNVTSSLSSDGVLTITAPKKNLTPITSERLINVVQTGVPATCKPISTETTAATAATGPTNVVTTTTATTTIADKIQKYEVLIGRGSDDGISGTFAPAGPHHIAEKRRTQTNHYSSMPVPPPPPPSPLTNETRTVNRYMT